MNRQWLILLISLVIVTGCSIDKGVKGKPQHGNTLDSIKVSYDIFRDDLFGGPGAKAYTLYIKNVSSSDITGCILTINGEYSAPLERMGYYHGFWSGTRKYGRDAIPSKITLEFEFSHDEDNHRVFRNAIDKPLSNNAIIKRLKIECDKGIGEWKFEPRFLLWKLK